MQMNAWPLFTFHHLLYFSDEVANIKREKDTLNDEISKLKYGLENSQVKL